MRHKKIIIILLLLVFLSVFLFVLVGIPLMEGVPIESIMAPKVNIKGWRGVRWEEREITDNEEIEYAEPEGRVLDKTKLEPINEWLTLYEDRIFLGFAAYRSMIGIIDDFYTSEKRKDTIRVNFYINDDYRTGEAPTMPQSVGGSVEIPLEELEGRQIEYTYIACHDYASEWDNPYNYYIGSYKTLFEGYDQTAEAVVYDAYKSIPFDALGAVYFEAEGKYQYKLPIPRYRARKKDNIAILSTHVTGKLKDLAPRYMEINEIYDRALAFKIDTTDIEKPIYVDRVLIYDDYNEIILREHVDYVWDAYRSQTYPEEIHNFRGSTYLYQVFLQEEHLNENEYRVVLER